MDTVEKISDRIILIDQGKIIADGTFEALRRNEGDSLEKLFSQLTGQSGFGQIANAFTQSFSKPEDPHE
jgi:ABC-2 type transport system ATP-binding protein